MSKVTDQHQLITYNGWSNKETWLANLWLTNDEGLDVLQEAFYSGSHPIEQANYLEDVMWDQLEEEAGVASLWNDLLSTAFARINWLEVIECNRL